MQRAFERKKTLIVLSVLFFLMAVLGICFVWTPAIYDYHLAICERFVDRVCYSQQSVLIIFLERFAGNALILFLVIAAGVHTIALVIPPVVLSFRAYTFGGSIAVFFSVYQLSGALIVLALYLPIHLLVDLVLLVASSLSFGRARSFRFCGEDFRTQSIDFGILLVALLLIGLLEMVLLLALFHPLGTLL